MPLSSYMFPLAIKEPLEKLQEAVDQPHGGKEVAYLDDVYILARPTRLANTMQHAGAAERSIDHHTVAEFFEIRVPRGRPAVAEEA